MKKLAFLFSLMFIFMNVIFPGISVSSYTNENSEIENLNDDSISENPQDEGNDEIQSGSKVESDEELDSIDKEENLADDTTDKIEEDVNIEMDNNTNNSSDDTNEVKNEEEIKTDSDITTEEDNKDLIGSEYKTIKKVAMARYSQSIPEEILEREEYLSDYEAALNMDYLVPKTDSTFEVVLSEDNGGYTFLEATENFEEAMDISNKYDEENQDNTAIPCVIDEDGVVVYSTNSMARFLKHTNGGVDNENVTLIYSDGALKTQYTYVNHNSVDDAPIISDNGNAVNILVSGYKGWVKKDTDSKTYDVIIVPMNKVTNPSYYTVKNGELYHYITTDLTAASGTSIFGRSIGVAPSYLKEGVKYYSYDENYFYTSLDTLITDLKANTNKNAVNGSSKYYNYYKYLPFRSKTSYTASQINSFIEKNTSSSSKLRGTGQIFIDAQNKYGVNAAIMLGIAINESAWGTSEKATTLNNIFGLAVYDSVNGAGNKYNSIQQCIEEFANIWMSKGYADPQDGRYYGGFLGGKSLGANVKYASDPFWGEKAASYALLMDKQLSNNNIALLNDFNYYTLAVYSAASNVISANGSTLYSVSNSVVSNATFVGVPVVLTSTTKYNKNNTSCYEILPARTTQLLSTGGSEFGGVYDWNTFGYVNASTVTLINASTNIGSNPDSNIMYTSQMQSYGWQGWKFDGETSGLTNELKRLEAIRIKLNNYPNASIRYSTHVQSIGWQEWKSNGEISGTVNQGLRVEAIKIEATGLPGNMELQYRTYVEGSGWQSWKGNGVIAGTVGERKMIQAIEVRVVEKSQYIQYSANVESIGWQSPRYNGEVAGTEGLGKRLEAIKINLHNYPGASVKYSAHVQSIGWQDWKCDGEVAGTEGLGKRLEAIKIEATGLPNNLEVQYRVHIQGIGWQEWKSSGLVAGTIGQGKRIEAIEIRIATKPNYIDYKAAVQTYGWQNYVKDGAIAGTVGQGKRLEAIIINAKELPAGTSIKYRSHVQGIGWESTWRTNGQVSGTTGQAKRLEAIQIQLVGAPSGYHIEYRTHIQSIGWQEWKKDGQVSGTTGQAKRIEAIEIRIVRD